MARKKIAIIGDIHGELNTLADVIHFAMQDHQPDAFLVVGDIGSEVLGAPAQQSDLRTGLYFASCQGILSLFQQTGVPAFFVAGNRDLPELGTPGEPVIHCDMLAGQDPGQIGAMQVVGLGGANYIGAWQYEWQEETALSHMAEAWASLDDIPTLFLSHCPPLGCRLDLLGNGVHHIGSAAVRVLLRRFQPLMCVSGHVHEGAGVDVVDGCLLINAGSLVGKLMVSIPGDPRPRPAVIQQHFVVEIDNDRQPDEIRIIRIGQPISPGITLAPMEYVYRAARGTLSQRRSDGTLEPAPMTGDLDLSKVGHAPSRIEVLERFDSQ